MWYILTKEYYIAAEKKEVHTQYTCTHTYVYQDG